MDNAVMEIKEGFALPRAGSKPLCAWSRAPVFEYKKESVTALSRIRFLKERDTFIFGNESVIIYVTLADYGYAGEVVVTVVDTAQASGRTMRIKRKLPMGKLDLPVKPSYGDVIFRSKKASIDFIRSPGKRYVRAHINNFDDVRALYINVMICDPEGDMLSAAIPVEQKRRHFMLREWSGGLSVSGKLVIGGDSYELLPEESSCQYERTRGVFADRDTLRLSATGICSAGHVGLNVCGGEGYFTAENGSVCGGKLIKHENIDFHELNDGWRVRSDDGHLKLTFRMLAKREDELTLCGAGNIITRQFGIVSGELWYGGAWIKLEGLSGCVEKVSCLRKKILNNSY